MSSVLSGNAKITINGKEIKFKSISFGSHMPVIDDYKAELIKEYKEPISASFTCRLKNIKYRKSFRGTNSKRIRVKEKFRKIKARFWGYEYIKLRKLKKVEHPSEYLQI